MRRKRIVQWSVVGVVILVAFLAASGRIPGRVPSADQGEPPVVGRAAPSFDLGKVDGGTVELRQLRGKWVLLTFWTTWCHACVSQEPHLQAAYEEMGGEVEFIGINLGESRERVGRHVTPDITFAIALDSDQKTGMAYNIRYLPTTFAVDDEGIIRGIRLGAFPSKDDVIAWLDDLILGEATSS